MLLDVSQTDPITLYHFLIGAVTPRPIALQVTSVDREGPGEPGSLQFLQRDRSANPPLVVFSAARWKRDGCRKDTLSNVEATGEFVLNAAVAELAEQMNLTRAPSCPAEACPARPIWLDWRSGAIRQGTTTPGGDLPVHMECVLHQLLTIGRGPGGANLVIGEVVLMHADDAVLDEQGRIDPHKLQTIGRLGGDYYCQTSALFTMKRP